jgi:ParB family transcriptional regulator, chromosome partitioning protein
MPDPVIHQIPLAAIDDDALSRDRTGLDPEPLRELRDSILKSGLRMPVELFELAEPTGEQRYGILSGFRRIAAFRELHETYGLKAYAAIPAFVRAPADAAAAFAAMVEENAVRADLSPWERGRIAVIARDQGVFPTIEEAVDRLYPTANRAKRARLRAIARLAEVLEGTLTDPERLSERRAVRLADAVRSGFGEIIEAALRQSSLKDPDSQWAILLPYLIESEQSHEPEPDPSIPVTRRRPRRLGNPRPGLVIRRQRTRDGWCLHFTGRQATGPMIDDIFDEIDRMFAPA